LQHFYDLGKNFTSEGVSIMIAVCQLTNKSEIIKMIQKAFIIKSAQKFLKTFYRYSTRNIILN